jgi:hypothetical protein
MKHALGIVALTAACAAGQYRLTQASAPLTPRELGSHSVSVVDKGEPALALPFSQALANQGFAVVDRPPYREDLEVTLRHARSAPMLVATLRSDGFFVDEARVPEDQRDALAQLASSLAQSQGMADFVRNSGTPQQAGQTAP